MAGDEKLLSSVLNRSKNRDLSGLSILKNCKPDIN